MGHPHAAPLAKLAIAACGDDRGSRVARAADRYASLATRDCGSRSAAFARHDRGGLVVRIAWRGEILGIVPRPDTCGFSSLHTIFYRSDVIGCFHSGFARGFLACRLAQRETDPRTYKYVGARGRPRPHREHIHGCFFALDAWLTVP